MSLPISASTAIQAAGLAAKVVTQSIDAMTGTTRSLSGSFAEALESASTSPPADDLASVVQQVQSLLGSLGIPTDQPIEFRVRDNGSIELVGDHPSGAAIEAGIHADPALHRTLSNWLRQQPSGQGVIGNPPQGPGALP